MPNFSSSFHYVAVDKVTPVLKKIQAESAKIHAQLRQSTIKTGKNHVKTNMLMKRSSDKLNKQMAKAHISANDDIVADSRKTQLEVTKIIQKESVKRNKMLDVGQGMKNVGSSINRNFTLPFVAATTLAVVKGAQFEDAMSSLEAITGVTGNTLKSLRADILLTSKATGLGAGEIAKGMELIGSKQPQLLKTPKLLLEVAKASSTMAHASGLSFEEAGASLSDVMNQFNFTGEQANEAINILAAGSKFGAAAIPELSRAMVLSGAAANSAKVSMQENAAMIEVLAGKGLNGARAGTQLRNVLLKLETAADKKLRPSLVGIQSALERAKLKFKDAGKATKFFGVENFNASQILMLNSDAVADMTQKVTGTNIAMEQAKIRTKTFTHQLKLLWTSIEGDLIKVFEIMRPALVKFLKVSVSIVKVISNFIKNNKTLVIVLLSVGAAVSALGFALTALGGAVVVLAQVKMAMVAFGATTAHATLAVKTLGIAMKFLGPIAAVIGAALAGWTIGSLIAEIPEVKRQLNLLSDFMQEKFFAVDDIKLTEEQKLAKRNADMRILKRKQEAREANRIANQLANKSKKGAIGASKTSSNLQKNIAKAQNGTLTINSNVTAKGGAELTSQQTTLEGNGMALKQKAI